ncbi:MAG: GNAT family N-acetyltransferase, partial [Rhodocyclaceae bacterium]|nr:GNAT family N-acetyltransferase [Rhodocyclaceae bacterium]
MLRANRYHGIGLHASSGFTMIGVFRDLGFKFDRWLDS